MWRYAECEMDRQGQQSPMVGMTVAVAVSQALARQGIDGI